QKASRRITKLAKRAIFAIHKGELDEARELLKKAGEELRQLRSFLLDRPEVASLGMLNPAYQEYAEAELLLAFVAGSEPPGPSEIGAPPDQYLLGLADVIGELRRRALEALKAGELEEAERSLGLMEFIYMELVSLDEAQAVLSELRRKCDVARRLIEATRGDIALETRRLALEKAMKELEGLLRAERQA
ncbi:MAG TPA: haloacid dehalogenase, partial [Candidatus Bathyarchaeota archaeon]|nr:haloacid dehalogenase [Candidatus Bathyarchaeota archaeon]